MKCCGLPRILCMGGGGHISFAALPLHTFKGTAKSEPPTETPISHRTVQTINLSTNEDHITATKKPHHLSPPSSHPPQHTIINNCISLPWDNWSPLGRGGLPCSVGCELSKGSSSAEAEERRCYCVKQEAWTFRQVILPRGIPCMLESLLIGKENHASPTSMVA